MAAEWFMFLNGAFCQMWGWENKALEKAVSDGIKRFPLAWKFEHVDETVEIEVEIDLIAMTRTHTQNGTVTVRRLMRLADGTSHTATSPFRPPV